MTEKEKHSKVSKVLRRFFRNCDLKFNWRETNISPKDLKHLEPTLRKWFFITFDKNKEGKSIVYLRLRKEEFIYLPKNSKRVKALQQVQVIVKPLSFSV